MSQASYLLDTNILSALIKQPAGAVAHHIQDVGEDSICTSIVAACELRFGAAKKGSARLVQKVDELLARIAVLPLQQQADQRYAEIRTRLEKRGKPIGPNDLLIAAHALALAVTVVTDNEAEFRRVPGLRVQNWLRVR